MDLLISHNELIEKIGRERFELACIEARKIASEPDYGRNYDRNPKVTLHSSPSFDVSDEIGDLV